MDSREKKIVYLTSTVHALVHMQMLTFAAVNVGMAADLGTSIEGIGFIGVVGYFLFGFGALPAGFVIDRIGARRVIALCTLGMAVADVMLYFAPSAPVAIAGLALLGLSASLYHPAGLGLISRNVKQTGHAMALHGMIGNIGVAGGPLVAGLIAGSFGWRWAYALPLAISALMAFVYFTTRFGDVGEDARHNDPNPGRRFAPGMLRILLLVIVLQMLSGFIYRASNTFMPAYTGGALSEFFSSLDPTARGGLITGIILIAGSIGQYVSGRLTKRHQTERLQVVAAVLVAPLLLGVGMLGGWALLITAMAFSFIFYGLQPLGNTLVAKYSPPALRGRSYGLSFFLNFGLGAFGSGFAGSVAHRQGYNVIYIWLAGVAALSILFAWLVLLFSRKWRSSQQ